MTQNRHPTSPTPPPNPSGDDSNETNANAGDGQSEVEKQRDDYLEQLQRTQAEFVNFQKRSKGVLESERAYAVSTLAGDLLDVLDNCERGADAARAAGAPASFAEGFNMIHRQLSAVLAKHGVEPIAATGQHFDPNFHEALNQEIRPDLAPNTVVSELTKGYRIRDRVLRPSRVTVSVQQKQH